MKNALILILGLRAAAQAGMISAGTEGYFIQKIKEGILDESKTI